MWGSHLEPVTRFSFSVWELRVSWCVAPSLRWGYVCSLLVHLLPGLATAATLGTKSRRTFDHIYCLIWDSPTPAQRARSSYLYPLGAKSSNYTPRHGVLFFLAPCCWQEYGVVSLTRLHTFHIGKLSKFCLYRMFKNSFTNLKAYIQLFKLNDEVDRDHKFAMWQLLAQRNGKNGKQIWLLYYTSCSDASSLLRTKAADFFFNSWWLEIHSDIRIRHIPRCVH
jgi:hypothetical protein